MYKLVAIVDRSGWAYWHRAKALEKYAPTQWDVNIIDWPTLCSHPDSIENANVIYLTDYVLTRQVGAKIRAAVPFVVSFNADAKRRQELWPICSYHANWVIAVSRERYEQRGSVVNCCHIPNGICLNTFHPLTPIATRPEKIVAIASHKAGADKRTELWEPTRKLLEAIGIQCDFRQIDPANAVSQEKMAEWYSSASWCLSTSRTEGTANSILEAAACGCCPVTTPVGQFVSECGKEGESYVALSENPTPEEIVEAILQHRANKASMGTAALAAVKRFDYKAHSHHYFDLFERLARNRPPAKAYAYEEKIP